MPSGRLEWKVAEIRLPREFRSAERPQGQFVIKSLDCALRRRVSFRDTSAIRCSVPCPLRCRCGVLGPARRAFRYAATSIAVLNNSAVHPPEAPADEKLIRCFILHVAKPGSRYALPQPVNVHLSIHIWMYV